MLLPLLPLFADAASSLPNPDTTRVEVSLDATGDAAPNTDPWVVRSAAGSLGVSGFASVAAFPWKPLVDDESPRSLQSFLQRTSYVAFNVGAQYLQVNSSQFPGIYAQDNAAVSVTLRWFMLPYLALLGAAGGSYERDEQTPGTYPYASLNGTFWRGWGSLGLDLRSGDASLTAQLQNIGYGAGAPPPGFPAPSAMLAGRIVIDRRYDLAASIVGGSAPWTTVWTASFGWYPTKDLGLSIAGEVGCGDGLAGDCDSILAGPAVSWWVAPRVELWASSSLAWLNWVPNTLWPEVTLGIRERIPGR